MKKLSYLILIIIGIAFVSCTGSNEQKINLEIQKLIPGGDKEIVVKTKPPVRNVTINNNTDIDIILVDDIGTTIETVYAQTTKIVYGAYTLDEYPDASNEIMTVQINNSEFNIEEYMEITTNTSGNPIINWNGSNASNISSFKIYRAINTGSYSLVHTASSQNSNNWIDISKVEASHVGGFGYFQSWYKVIETRTDGSTKQIGSELYIKTFNSTLIFD